MKNYTDITVLLDRSASMLSIKEAMESAFDEFVLGHQAIEETRLTLYTFDEPAEFQYMNVTRGQANFDYFKTRIAYERVYSALPIKNVPKLELVPRGNTPLIDALCGVIDETGRRFATMDAAERPSRVLFVVITDGQENASKTFKREDAFERITTQTNVWKWQFLYLGANKVRMPSGKRHGIAAPFAMNYVANEQGTQDMMRSVTTSSLRYASGQDLSLTK